MRKPRPEPTRLPPGPRPATEIAFATRRESSHAPAVLTRAVWLNATTGAVVLALSVTRALPLHINVAVGLLVVVTTVNLWMLLQVSRTKDDAPFELRVQAMRAMSEKVEPLLGTHLTPLRLGAEPPAALEHHQALALPEKREDREASNG